MLIKKVTVLATILLASACSSTDTTEQQISTLNQKVDKLTMEVSKLKLQQEKNSALLKTLKQDNKETNKRIDNVTASYKK